MAPPAAAGAAEAAATTSIGPSGCGSNQPWSTSHCQAPAVGTFTVETKCPTGPCCTAGNVRLWPEAPSNRRMPTWPWSGFTGVLPCWRIMKPTWWSWPATSAAGGSSRVEAAQPPAAAGEAAAMTSTPARSISFFIMSVLHRAGLRGSRSSAPRFERRATGGGESSPWRENRGRRGRPTSGDEAGFPPGFFRRTDEAPDERVLRPATPRHPHRRPRHRGGRPALRPPRHRRPGERAPPGARPHVVVGVALRHAACRAGRAGHEPGRARRPTRRRPSGSATTSTRTPTLPFPDASFDAVTCCVSIDYLVRPVAGAPGRRRGSSAPAGWSSSRSATDASRPRPSTAG